MTSKDFHPLEGDKLSFSGQKYTAVDTAAGEYITFKDSAGNETGHVTLEGVHTFDKAWVI